MSKEITVSISESLINEIKEYFKENYKLKISDDELDKEILDFAKESCQEFVDSELMFSAINNLGWKLNLQPNEE
jgi:hypothetical protein